MLLEVRTGIGPHRSHSASLWRDGEQYAYEYSSRPHCAAWAAGANAGLAGVSLNPYRKDVLDTRGRIALGRRGFRNAWRRGNDAAKSALLPAPEVK